MSGWRRRFIVTETWIIKLEINDTTYKEVNKLFNKILGLSLKVNKGKTLILQPKWTEERYKKEKEEEIRRETAKAIFNVIEGNLYRQQDGGLVLFDCDLKDIKKRWLK